MNASKFILFCVIVWLAAPGTCYCSNDAIIADLVEEWSDRQPIGSWRLLRGPKDAGAQDLLELERFESAVSGNPDVSIWTFGENIFGAPNFTRRSGKSSVTLTARSEQDSDGNGWAGAAYIEWTNAEKTRDVELAIRLRNVGTDVKGGDGMTFVVYQVEEDDTFLELDKVVVPPSNQDAPIENSVFVTVKGGQKCLFKILPNIDGFGDALAISIQVKKKRISRTSG